jgi:hypothetical protein
VGSLTVCSYRVTSVASGRPASTRGGLQAAAVLFLHVHKLITPVRSHGDVGRIASQVGLGWCRCPPAGKHPHGVTTHQAAAWPCLTPSPACSARPHPIASPHHHASCHPLHCPAVSSAHRFPTPGPFHLPSPTSPSPQGQTHIRHRYAELLLHSGLVTREFQPLTELRLSSAAHWACGAQVNRKLYVVA